MDMGLTKNQLDKLFGVDESQKETPIEYILLIQYPISTIGWSDLAKRITEIWDMEEQEYRDRELHFGMRNQKTHHSTLLEKLSLKTIGFTFIGLGLSVGVLIFLAITVSGHGAFDIAGGILQLIAVLCILGVILIHHDTGC